MTHSWFMSVGINWVNVTLEIVLGVIFHLLYCCVSFFQSQREPGRVSQPLIFVFCLVLYIISQLDAGFTVVTHPDCNSPSSEPSVLLSVLVILSVVAIMGVSAAVYFLHQKHNLGPTFFTAFEYHPPFRVLDADQSCLVEAEETDSVP